MSEPLAPGTKSEQPHHRGRRRRHSGTNGARRLLYAAVLMSAAALLMWPLAVYMGWTRPREAVSKGAPGNPSDLVLSEAVFTGEGPTRHIAGTLRNVSAKRYEDIEVIFAMRDGRGNFVGTTPAKVTAVSPGGTAPFETGPIPPEAARLALRDINGTAR